MNIIEPKFEIIEQSFDGDLLSDMFKHIELCGRTCYKSEDKITDDSMFKFIEHLEKSEHGAMLEQYLPPEEYSDKQIDEFFRTLFQLPEVVNILQWIKEQTDEQPETG